MTKHWKPALLCVAAASAITLAACGRKETMAAKSAAAYREAQVKDVAVAVDHSKMDHSTMDPSKTTHADHATMDHSKMTHATTMDHSKMAHSTMPGMDHGVDHSTAHPATTNHPPAHTGHTAAPDHAAMPGMQQHQHTTPAPVATAVTVAPRSSTDVERIDPAATLSPDDFDAPAPASVEEAQKAAGGDPHAGHAMPPAKKEQR